MYLLLQIIIHHTLRSVRGYGIFEENRKPEHGRYAKNGWYRYDTSRVLSDEAVYNNRDLRCRKINYERLSCRHAEY